MTIGKQLYKGFGVLLAILAVLLVVDLAALWKARSASNEAAATLESVRTAEAVRFQIMQNRLNLNNFLLSGDPRITGSPSSATSSNGANRRPGTTIFEPP